MICTPRAADGEFWGVRMFERARCFRTLRLKKLRIDIVKVDIIEVDRIGVAIFGVDISGVLLYISRARSRKVLLGAMT